MRWRLFQVGDTAVWIHPAALIVALYMAVSGYGGLLVAGMLSAILHEGAHALVSTCFHNPPEDVEITPLGALMRLEDDEALPLFRRFLVLTAGPVMTLLLCYASLSLTAKGYLPWAMGRQLFLCNAAMLLINLLPAMPLDGGRILSMLLAMVLRGETVRTIMRAVGTALGIGCVLINLWLSWQTGGWNLSLAAAGCFLMYSAAGATTSLAMTELRHFMDRKSRIESQGAMPCRWVTLAEDATLRQAVRSLHPRRHTMFHVIGRGFLTEQQLISAYLDDPMDTAGALAGRMRESCQIAPTFAD